MKLNLATRDLYYYQGGMAQQPHPISIYQFYDLGDHPKPLVLTLEEDFEFCDALDLMFGKTPRRVPIWDWHDEFWDRLHDKRGNWNADYLIAGVVSDRYDLQRLCHYPQEFDRIRRHEMERRERNKRPPVYYTGSLEFI